MSDINTDTKSINLPVEFLLSEKLNLKELATIAILIAYPTLTNDEKEILHKSENFVDVVNTCDKLHSDKKIQKIELGIWEVNLQV